MALWTPALIETALWLDAADSATITLESGAVAQWADKSGNARHAAQSSAGSRPVVSTASINSKDALLFSSDFLSIAGALPVTAEMAEFVVFGRASTGVLSMPLGGSTANSPPYGIQIYTDNIAYSALNATAGGYVTHGSVGATGIFQSALQRNATTAQLFIHGTSLGGSLPVGSADGANPITTVGARASSYHNGLIAEIITLAATPTTETRQLVEGYLAHKWGIASSLPTGHPYKDSPPALTVFGISGTITDRFGQPCQRKVYAVSRPTDTATPIILAHGLSDPTTGAYELVLPTDEEVTRVVVSEDDDPLLNDIVHRVIPG
jgi:hypothetical protein